MRLLTAVALAAVSLLVVGCADSEPVVTQDIVSAIPWPDQERTEYVAYDSAGQDEVGTGTFTATRQGDEFELELSYEGEDTLDESTIAVDATTLKPFTLHREIHTDENDRVVDGEYNADEMIVTITLKQDDDPEEQTVRRLEEHYYDNDSSIFLWRTITFVEGYEASYHSVLTNRGRSTVITLNVTGKEEITVPAGTFNTWVVEIEAGGAKQKAWFADTPEHRLVQYDNTLNVFRLKSIDGA